MSPQALNPPREGLIAGYDNSDEFSPFRPHLRTIRLRKTEVAITLEHLAEQWEEQKGKCLLTGWELDNSPRHRNENPNAPHRASVDRIDPRLGYVPDNVRWLSAMANYAKHQWSDAVVDTFAAAVLKRQEAPAIREAGGASFVIGPLAFREHLRRFKRRRLDSNVTLDELVDQWDQQAGTCALTGWALELVGERKSRDPWNPHKASVDRIDSSRGYEAGNIRWVSLIANCAKHIWDDDVVLAFARSVVAQSASGQPGLCGPSLE